jgi:hypothetical protein
MSGEARRLTTCARSFSRVRRAWNEFISCGCAFRLPTCVPGRSRRVSDGGDPGPLGSIIASQINHAIPDRRAAHVVRESRLWVGLALSQLRLSGTSWCSRVSLAAFHLASPGEAGASATVETRGRLASIFANQTNHAIPDRRAPGNRVQRGYPGPFASHV